MDTSDLMAQLRQIPPVTRTLVFSALGVTLPVALHFISPYPILFDWSRIINNLQIWRLVTPFFYAGSGLSVLFNLFIFYRNSVDLETRAFNSNTVDYVWCLLVLGGSIIGTNYPLDSMIFFHQLQTALLYLWSRFNPHSQISLYGFITIPAPYTPFLMLGLDYLQIGFSYALQGATGIVAGHIWWWLREERGLGGHLAVTPSWVRTFVNFLSNIGGWIGGTGGATSGHRPGGGGTGGTRGFGARTTTAPGGGGSSTGVSLGGYSWGRGQRLGD